VKDKSLSRIKPNVDINFSSLEKPCKKLFEEKNFYGAENLERN